MLPKEITRLINKVGETTLWEVEKGAIRKYADAVGDQNPLYCDEEYASKSRFGTIIAPPAFFGWPERWGAAGPIYSSLQQELTKVLAKAGYSQGLYGGVEFDFYHPVHTKDIISVTPRIKDIYEREGNTGIMVFFILETTYTNQNGEVVAESCETIIRR